MMGHKFGLLVMEGGDSSTRGRLFDSLHWKDILTLNFLFKIPNINEKGARNDLFLNLTDKSFEACKCRYCFIAKADASNPLF